MSATSRKSDRDIALDVLEAVGASRDFWDRADGCRVALVKAETVIRLAFAERLLVKCKPSPEIEF